MAPNNTAAPGALISIFGVDLATELGFPDQLSLPTDINGTRVLVNNIPAPLTFVSPGQINAQMPFAPEIPVGSHANVVVQVAGRPDSTPGEIRNHLVSVGVGASIRIRPRTALIVEWRPRVAGFRGRLSRNTFAFGIQRSTNRHVFALTFSNTQSTTTTRSLTDGLDDLRIGFNLYRRLW